MNLSEAVSKMAKSVEMLSQQLRGIRGSQISPNLISSIKVGFGGQMVPIEYLATTVAIKNQVSVSLFDPSILKDDPGIMGRIEKAISGAGFTAYVFSKDKVMISTQPFGQKEEVSAHIRRSAEDARVAIRNIRKKAKKDGVDERDLQRATDRAIGEVDAIAQGKLDAI